MTDAPTNLPRLARDYTPEQREACVEWLSSLPLADLRERQAIMRQQIDAAYALATKANPAPYAADALQDCQDKDEQITDALMRWLDRRNA